MMPQCELGQDAGLLKRLFRLVKFMGDSYIQPHESFLCSISLQDTQLVGVDWTDGIWFDVLAIETNIIDGMFPFRAVVNVANAYSDIVLGQMSVGAFNDSIKYLMSALFDELVSLLLLYVKVIHVRHELIDVSSLNIPHEATSLV